MSNVNSFYLILFYLLTSCASCIRIRCIVTGICRRSTAMCGATWASCTRVRHSTWVARTTATSWCTTTYVTLLLCFVFEHDQLVYRYLLYILQFYLTHYAFDSTTWTLCRARRTWSRSPASRVSCRLRARSASRPASCCPTCLPLSSSSSLSL